MSEFEKQDEQVIAMANSEHRRPAASHKFESADAKEEAARERKLLLLAIKVMGCVLAAVVFLAAMLDPAWVPVLGYSGILIFLIMAAIMLDRHFREYRNGK